MKNPSASNKPGFTSAIQEKVKMRRSLICGVIAVALLTGVTWVRPLTGSHASAETSAKAGAELTGAKSEAKLLSVTEAEAMSGGQMTEEEAAAFANFINTVAAEDVCWKDTSTRGVGTPLTSCPAGTVKEGLLCYKKCPAGYSATPADAFCRKDCPAGFTNDGLTCRRDVQIIGKSCPSGYTDDGATCRKDAVIISADNGDCPWYDKCGLTTNKGCSKCPSGYSNDGCTCRRDAHIFGKHEIPCPEGFTNDGATCRKDAYIFGRDTVKRDPAPMGCGPGKEEQAGLCYNPCPAGSKGVGPVCWVDCPSRFPENCGAACAQSRAACVSNVVKMVTSTVEMTLNLASLVSGAGAAKTAIKAGIKPMVKATLSASARAAMKAEAKRVLRANARKAGKTIAEEALETASSALVGSYEKGEFDWTALDPTGIAAVVEAFNKPICGR